MDIKLFKKIDEAIWELPISFREGMKTVVRFIATEKLLKDMEDHILDQATNVAMFQGLAGPVCIMPDAHFGYGAPIGAVFATDPDQEGIISPGAAGFDLNCGMRLITTNLNFKDVEPKLTDLVDTLFTLVPTGVGSKGSVRLTPYEFKELMVKGVSWCVEKGLGWKEDIWHCEELGKIEGADPNHVSKKAIQRGINQLGSLGSGNHYLEIQLVGINQIYDFDTAKRFGIDGGPPAGGGQVVIMVHCGSRGFGHQVATDYLREFEKVMPKYGISVPDRQLVCAPFNSPEGKAYYSGMAAAANNAFCNRQVITHQVRKAFEQVFQKKAKDLEMNLVYDVAHNIVKKEKHLIPGTKIKKELIVHRKGATRSFGPGNKELPEKYHDIGQPVIIGGSMETGSYLLVGTKKAHGVTFASTAHGSGRTMSRAKAKRIVRGEKLQKKMRNAGIYVRSASLPGLAEEAGIAYKDINEVVRAVDLAGIGKPVASFKPIGNIKG